MIALSKGYSKSDPLATTIIRAARVVAANCGIDIYTEWEPRRTSRGSRVADNLSHNLLRELTHQELEAYLENGYVNFPAPILQWMAHPEPDQSLGLKCVKWIRSKHPEVKDFKPIDVL